MLYGAPGELPSLPALRATVGDAFVDVVTSEIEDDWSTRWREFPPAGRGGGNALRARALARSAPPRHGLIDIVIEPAQAFGTGAHATTQLCLELLVELARAGEARGPLLDLGAGSGVLAIAAAKLGFAPVVGARPRARVRARRPPRTRAPTASRSTSLAPTCAATRFRRLRPSSRTCWRRCCWSSPRASSARRALLIASGLLREQADEVAGAFTAMRERARRERGEWAALLLERREPAGARVSLDA